VLHRLLSLYHSYLLQLYQIVKMKFAISCAAWLDAFIVASYLSAHALTRLSEQHGRTSLPLHISGNYLLHLGMVELRLNE
jgi:hypothetical protein